MLRIKLRYDDVETLVQRFAPHVGKLGLFLPSKSLQPIGAEVKFELRLSTDEAMLVGLGRVREVRAADPQNPRAAFGMTIELMRVTPQSRSLILRMLERRRAIGLPETSLPTADDVDAARRAEVLDGGIRDFASGPVAVTAASVSEPHALPELLTSPRRTGPIGVAMVAVVAPLAPEPPRRKRMAISEVIESASGPVAMATTPIEDEPVDLAAVLARARVLAANGGSIDAELDALLDAQAAPVEIGIEAASAELAERLGGRPVSKRIARGDQPRWAPPPPTASESSRPVDGEASEPPESARADAQEPNDADAPATESNAFVAEPNAEVEPEPPSSADGRAFGPPNIEVATEPRRGRIFDDDDDAVAELDLDAATLGTPLDVTPLPVHDEQIADEVDQLADADLEDVEHTQIGAAPIDPDTFEGNAYMTQASAAAQADLAEQLEQQLAEAEADDLGFAPAGTEAAYAQPTQLEDDEIEALEIDDFEILAEADEGDADLLAAHGEQDASAPHRPSGSDFAQRLDLGDESQSDLYPAPAVVHDYRLDRDERMPSLGDALAALEDEPSYRRAPQPVFDPDPSNSFTLAADLRDEGIDFDEPHGGFRTPHAFDQSDVIDIRSSLPPQRAAEPASLRSTPRAADDDELESALEALDVDLDDLAMPHAQTELQRGPLPSAPAPIVRAGTPSRAPEVSRRSQPTPGTAIPRQTTPPVPASGRVRLPRASTDDGVLIDFDDDD